MNDITFNPEGSKLRKNQKEVFAIFKIFIKILEEYDIQWWLCSGTLLGAARHKGFVPWDDDMDIMVLREDFDKIAKIMESYKSDEFIFQTKDSDPDFIGGWGKFRRIHGRVSSKSKRNQYFKYAGIGFDIFPIEKCNYFSALWGNRLYTLAQRTNDNIKITWLRRLMIKINKIMFFKLIFPIFKVLGKLNVNEEYRNSLGIGWPQHKYYLKDIFPLTKLEFEGEMFPAPGNFDKFLTNIYGDWRSMPSLEQIRNSIHCTEYIDEIFGDNN
ncbi:MAG: LicD family protein [Lachnospiraceae bacterium]|nr:LicD family protein [Lachnospiraceae bacterium]